MVHGVWCGVLVYGDGVVCIGLLLCEVMCAGVLSCCWVRADS